jgi:hypothetical protein
MNIFIRKKLVRGEFVSSNKKILCTDSDQAIGNLFEFFFQYSFFTLFMHLDLQGGPAAAEKRKKEIN